MNSFSLSKTKTPIGQRNSGQIVVEYVLLLAVAVIIAAVITNGLVSRNPDPQQMGSLTRKWQQILQTIGNDWADSAN